MGLPVSDCTYCTIEGGSSNRGSECIWKNSRRTHSSRRRRRRAVACPAVAATEAASDPGSIAGGDTIVQADQIYLPRHALPPSLIARLIRLAAFQNPEFYAAQAMRRSTHDKPRIISCAELTSRHVALPRGCFDAVWAIESVCHACDKRMFFQESRRLLRDGGRLGIVEYMRARRPYSAAAEELLRSNIKIGDTVVVHAEGDKLAFRAVQPEQGEVANAS